MSAGSSTSWALTARWVFPVDTAPVENGVVSIDGEHITGVQPGKDHRADLDLGNVAILPGLVNAHTHLDLSDMDCRARPGVDFIDWLRGVVAHRRRQTAEQVQAAVAAGLNECIRFGTTLIGDISSLGASWPLHSRGQTRAVVFREQLGLSKDRAAQALHEARTWLKSRAAAPTCRPGLSPHAPYSVRRDLFAGAVALAEDFRVPLSVHLAETSLERELLATRHGPFESFLRELGVWDGDGLAESFADVLKLCGDRAGKLFIHGNYLEPAAEIPSNSSLVFCPRTHAAFGHPRHPFPRFLERGINVALGTDSRASNPDLDVLAEARFVRERYPEMSPAAILRMATLSGAEALGWDEETGSLTPGKSADFVVIPLPDVEAPDPHDLILQSTTPVRAVLFRGQWLTNRPA